MCKCPPGTLVRTRRGVEAASTLPPIQLGVLLTPKHFIVRQLRASCWLWCAGMRKDVCSAVPRLRFGGVSPFATQVASAKIVSRHSNFVDAA